MLVLYISSLLSFSHPLFISLVFPAGEDDYAIDIYSFGICALEVRDISFLGRKMWRFPAAPSIPPSVSCRAMACWSLQPIVCDWATAMGGVGAGCGEDWVGYGWGTPSMVTRPQAELRHLIGWMEVSDGCLQGAPECWSRLRPVEPAVSVNMMLAMRGIYPSNCR